MFLSFSPPGDVRPSLCLYYPHLQYNKKDFMSIFQIFLFLYFPPGGTGSIPRFILPKSLLLLAKLYDNYADSLRRL